MLLLCVWNVVSFFLSFCFPVLICFSFITIEIEHLFSCMNALLICFFHYSFWLSFCYWFLVHYIHSFFLNHTVFVKATCDFPIVKSNGCFSILILLELSGAFYRVDDSLAVETLLHLAFRVAYPPVFLLTHWPLLRFFFFFYWFFNILLSFSCWSAQESAFRSLFYVNLLTCWSHPFLWL